MTEVPDVLATVEPYLREYGYPTLFFMVFFEAFGIPVPGESVIVSAALLAAKGELDLFAVMVVAWIAASLGNTVGYAIGVFGGRRLALRLGSRVGMTEDRFEKVERFFDRYGISVVVFARFVVPARQLSGIIAGAASMSWWRFCVANLVGAALWVVFWSLGGHYVGEHAAVVLAWAERHWVLATVVVVGALLIVGLYVTPAGRRLKGRVGERLSDSGVWERLRESAVWGRLRDSRLGTRIRDAVGRLRRRED